MCGHVYMFSFKSDPIKYRQKKQKKVTPNSSHPSLLFVSLIYGLSLLMSSQTVVKRLFEFIIYSREKESNKNPQLIFALGTYFKIQDKREKIILYMFVGCVLLELILLLLFVDRRRHCRRRRRHRHRRLSHHMLIIFTQICVFCVQ